jgi:putative flippase GtrA
MAVPTRQRPPLLIRLVRFASVSAVAVVLTQSVLWLLNGPLGWVGWVANVVAVGVAAVPAYLLNRAWVWAKEGPHSVSREIVPFWTYTFCGLALSTLLVAIADEVWGTTVAVQLANLAGFGVLWVGKFILLDRVLFRTEPAPM